jgi:hypothetical protein
MKAKLHKMESGYILSLNGDIDDPYAIVNKELAEDYEWYKLSLKNCQAIELGYDLDELAKEECEYNQDSLRQYDSKFIEFYKEGFQKALEILGDKKFTENNIDEAFDTGYEMLDSPKKYNDTLKDFKESLEQTEWDVEIVCLHTGDPEHTTNTGLPKLDEDGCLILKRI